MDKEMKMLLFSGQNETETIEPVSTHCLIVNIIMWVPTYFLFFSFYIINFLAVNEIGKLPTWILSFLDLIATRPRNFYQSLTSPEHSCPTLQIVGLGQFGKQGVAGVCRRP